MSDVGPTWLRHELPQPIASAWHMALLHDPPDGLAIAGAVEVALRFVSALQIAVLVARGEKLPPMLTEAGFKRPTLGSWLKLVRTLDAMLDDTPFAGLADWPGDDAEKLLDGIVRDRNWLAHPKQVSPGARRDVALQLAENAASFLGTLAWLRRSCLVVVCDQKPVGYPRFEGHLQVFRGRDVHPEKERARWTGELASERMYLIAVDAAVALDVEPFVRRARLGGGRVDAICLWAAYGARGDVLLQDDQHDQREFVPLVARPRLVPFGGLEFPVASDGATLPMQRALEHKAMRAERVAREAPDVGPEPPTVADRRVAKSRRPWWILAVFAALAAAVVIALALAAPSTPTPLAPPPPSCALAPSFVGHWRFGTAVLHAQPKLKAFEHNVVGDYSLDVSTTPACPANAEIEKQGYFQDGSYHDNHARAAAAFTPSKSGGSIAASVHLSSPDVGSVDLAMRLARVDDRLIGLWRYAGDAWTRYGYAGSIVGNRGATLTAVDATCFADCIARCHDGDDPLDDASEACLLSCAPKLDRCDAH